MTVDTPNPDRPGTTVARIEASLAATALVEASAESAEAGRRYDRALERYRRATAELTRLGVTE